ncbi:hypothetical protein EYF80_014973 [Liparis tanakae]|uniref:Uncharacterized protein n=1 Tax=Liparis tanakae TaxID=230148 RepID=A0A4Z2ICR1_9TELE|nr:hypothetical protein EYF80_014973 [Liparis tanakae]
MLCFGQLFAFSVHGGARTSRSFAPAEPLSSGLLSACEQGLLLKQGPRSVQEMAWVQVRHLIVRAQVISPPVVAAGPPPFLAMLFLRSWEIIVVPGKGIIVSSYELALFSSFRSTLDLDSLSLPDTMPGPPCGCTTEHSMESVSDPWRESLSWSGITGCCYWAISRKPQGSNPPARQNKNNRGREVSEDKVTYPLDEEGTT